MMPISMSDIVSLVLSNEFQCIKNFSFSIKSFCDTDSGTTVHYYIYTNFQLEYVSTSGIIVNKQAKKIRVSCLKRFGSIELFKFVLRANYLIKS